jgi:Ca-activated chloride channel family protein
VRYLSADDSNSEASPVVARQLVRAGRYVPPALIRSYEFLNHAAFDYPPPAAGQDVALYPELRKTGTPGHYSLQIAVRGPDRTLDKMTPMSAVVLLDVSGSMAGESIGLAREFLIGFSGRLRPVDRLSLVTVAREATTLLDNVEVGKGTAAQVRAALALISVSDVTNLGRGLKRAFELAAAVHTAERPARVIVVSDGAANAGRRAKRLIARHAKDADAQGIYLTGVGLGAGFDDSLMDGLTDRGRGAFVFLDGHAAIARLLEPRQFVATFDVAVKDVRLKQVLPPGWSIKAFHGEQISARKSKVIPQYLGPNDQMIYHLVVATEKPEEASAQRFEFEAEYRPIGGKAQVITAKPTVAEMLARSRRVAKGDAIVRYAEAFKAVRHPLLGKHRETNLAAWDSALAEVEPLAKGVGGGKDGDLTEVLALMRRYRQTLDKGEAALQACDREIDSPPVVLGIDPAHVKEVIIRGYRPKRAIKALRRLRRSSRLLPLQGARFLAIGTGPVGARYPANTRELRDVELRDPAPRYNGYKRLRRRGEPVWDVHQVAIRMQAPAGVKSFSFDFNYFSAEYPEYLNQEFNDTFYAILQAPSTNKGKSTNISFDPRRRSIEVDNNYFENAFHPIPNRGTGFDRDGSTGWLRTSWPIEGGETFTLTFSIHDEGDGIYDSLVILDNFRFHEYPAVGNTDPLN